MSQVNFNYTVFQRVTQSTTRLYTFIFLNLLTLLRSASDYSSTWKVRTGFNLESSHVPTRSPVVDEGLKGEGGSICKEKLSCFCHMSPKSGVGVKLVLNHTSCKLFSWVELCRKYLKAILPWCGFSLCRLTEGCMVTCNRQEYQSRYNTSEFINTHGMSSTSASASVFGVQVWDSDIWGFSCWLLWTFIFLV